MGAGPDMTHVAVRISVTFFFYFSDSDYGRKKKKKGGGGGTKKGGFRPKKTYFGAAVRGKRKIKRQDSDESDYNEKPKKQKRSKVTADVDRSNIVAAAGRRTRGVKINYSLIQG